MKRSLILSPVLIFFLFAVSCSVPQDPIYFSNIPASVERNFLGKEFWGNRLQDWEIKNGRLACTDGRQALRTMFPFRYEINAEPGDFRISVTTGALHNQMNDRYAFSGIIVGAGGLDLDWRARTLVFGRTGKSGGLIAGITSKGTLAIHDLANNLEKLAESAPITENFTFGTDQEYRLILTGRSENDGYTLELIEKKSGQMVKTRVPENLLRGHVGLVTDQGHQANIGSFWFKDLQLSGKKLSYHADRHMGPIVGTQHTLSRGILKMSVQMMPIAESDPDSIKLVYYPVNDTVSKKTAAAVIHPEGYIATFRIGSWNSQLDHVYTVQYQFSDNRGVTTTDTYQGMIRKDPGDKTELVVAAFTGNNNTSWHSQSFDETNLFFPHADLTEKVAMHKPDFLFYSGDQLYEGSPSPPDRSGGRASMLDYLYKWYLWHWAHRELTRNTPSVSIPDDHDVFHGNVWGDGGTIPPKEPENGIYPAYYRGGFESHWIQDYGGYRMGTDFVNMVDRTQTSHLPDPYDPRPVKNAIGVYYTDILYGGIGFAVLEDRKFKSAPSRILPDDRIVNGFSQIEGYDATKSDREEAVLLGQRQLDFLEHWVSDWEGTWMKVSLSQTIFANVSTYPDTFKTDAGTPRLQPLPQGVIPRDYSLAKDMDSNGWPQGGRNRALHVLRKGFTFMLAGDQHLGSVVHHGIDEWRDAGVSFCVPSVANVWPRRWFPPSPGYNHPEGTPDYTGDYKDGFGNRITVYAVSNPYISNIFPPELHDRAPGYGIVRLNKADQSILIECWPRHVNPEGPDAAQYPGWPLTFSVADNYGRKAGAWLPEFIVKGLALPPVIQVVDESTGEIVYSYRMKGISHHPKVFKKGSYTVSVGEPGTASLKTFKGVLSGPEPGFETIEVNF